MVQNDVGGVLREGYDYTFSRLDPATGAHVDPAWCAIYETATYLDPNGRLGPMVAGRWSTEENGLLLRLTVPPRRFHTGTLCDAEAVAAAFRVHADPIESPVNAFFWEAVADVQTAGDDVLLRLKHPRVGLPRLLRSWHAAIHNPAERERRGAGWGFGNADGTGPFRFKSWNPDAWLEVGRWPDYRGPVSGVKRGPARLDGIHWLALTDERERGAALEAGEIDCAQNVSALDAARLTEHPELEVLSFQQSALVYLALDHETPPFDRLEVRQAISKAIDREELVDTELAGYGWPQFGPIPSQDPLYEPAVERWSRLDRVGALHALDAARMPADERGVRLSLDVLVLGDAVVVRIAERVARHLRTVGIELRLTVVPGFAEFYAALGAHPAGFVSKWFWPDPVDALVGFVASWAHMGPNWQRASNRLIDDACEAWQTAQDETDARRAAAELQKNCAELLPLIPLVSPAAIWAHHRSVRGWRPNRANLYPLYDDVSLSRGAVHR